MGFQAATHPVFSRHFSKVASFFEAFSEKAFLKFHFLKQRQSADVAVS